MNAFAFNLPYEEAPSENCYDAAWLQLLLTLRKVIAIFALGDCFAFNAH